MKISYVAGFCRKCSVEVICGRLSPLCPPVIDEGERRWRSVFRGMRWYVAYPLRTRHVAALLEARGVAVDHSTMHRWTIQSSPRLAAALGGWTRPTARSRASSASSSAPSTNTARPWTFGAPDLVPQRPPDGCSRWPGAGMVSPRRARWTAVTPMPPPASAPRRRLGPRSRSARSNTFTPSWNKPIEQANGCPAPCEGAKPWTPRRVR